MKCTNKKNKKYNIIVIDLFCGIGGMTHGFILEDLNVVAGIDNNSTCRYGYEKNNGTKFIHKDILTITPEEIMELYSKKDAIKILIGCAPCQSYSGLNPHRKGNNDNKPLRKFAKLIEKVKPDIVSMENVKGLARDKKFPVFNYFLKILKGNGYNIFYDIIDCSDYGVPQRRKRLVLLASQFGPISLIPKTHNDSNRVTVKDVIFDLEPIKDGEVSEIDPIHRASKLKPINKERIRYTPHDGGSSDSWPNDLKLKCHKKDTGKTYKYSVYGRMKWNKPAPTMTTLCIGIGNGRFGHPEQNRAISLREAARFQTFPDNYEFIFPNDELCVGRIAKFIGNAVPVKLGVVIAKSIKIHLKRYA